MLYIKSVSKVYAFPCCIFTWGYATTTMNNSFALFSYSFVVKKFTVTKRSAYFAIGLLHNSPMNNFSCLT